MIIIPSRADTSERSQTLTYSFCRHDHNSVCETRKRALMGLSYAGRLLGIARLLVMEQPSTDAFLSPLGV